ncbi:MAG: hypothetical protein HQK50_18425 [Oligoflexia bacterium]|nr:hypothetical protein [Oligoflexia bacterium]MBF0367557.1 hypothetical protein [Oligoflexia bacterium]
MSKMDHKADKEKKEGAPQFDLRAWVLQNLRLVVACIVALVIASIGYGVFVQYKEKRDIEHQSALYSFRTDIWERYRSDSLPEKDLIIAFESLGKKIGYAEKGIGAMAIEMNNYLLEKERLQLALTLSKEVYAHNKNNLYVVSMLGRQLAVMYEDLGSTKEAIAILEDLNKSKMKLLEAKNYFDLGRLYALVGDKEKSKLNYQYVVDHFANDQFARLARVILKQEL